MWVAEQDGELSVSPCRQRRTARRLAREGPDVNHVSLSMIMSKQMPTTKQIESEIRAKERLPVV